VAFVSPEIWDDRRFRSLTPVAKLVWFYLLTNRASGAWVPGLYQFRLSNLGEDLDLPQPEAQIAFQALCNKGMVEYDAISHFVRIPKAPYYNIPRNFNALKAWYAKFRLVPRESPLKAAHLLVIEQVVGDLIAEAKRNNEADKARRWVISFNETFGQDKKAKKADRQGNLLDLMQLSGLDGNKLGTNSEQTPNGSETNQDQDQEKDLRSGSGSSGGVQRGAADFSPTSTPAPASAPAAEPVVGSQPEPQEATPGPKKRGRKPKVAQEQKSALSIHRDVAERLWKLQGELRAQVPGLRILKLDDHKLAQVACRLAEGATEDDAKHVLQVYAADAKKNPDQAQWFNGVTNWRRENFERTLGKPIPQDRDRHSVGHYKHTGREEYPDGRVKL
jgi:hypothetical protein